jgi:hypothetical protein
VPSGTRDGENVPTQLDPFLLTGSSGHDDLSLISSLLCQAGRDKEDEYKRMLRCIILTNEEHSKTTYVTTASRRYSRLESVAECSLVALAASFTFWYQSI